MKDVSDLAFQFLEGMMILNAFDEHSSIRASDLRQALDVNDLALFSEWMGELIDAGFVRRVYPTSVSDTIRYHIDVDEVAGAYDVDNGVITGGHPRSAIPASDRIVKLDHNLPEFEKIKSEISNVREAVRQANDIDEGERDRVLHGLDAAQVFWDATQLKIIQIKVGVLMAAEDALTVLAKTAKAVGAGLLIDLIKSFVKAHNGFDLDNI